MTDKIVLGVDGGGTSTRVALVGAGGALLGVGRAGSSNYDDVGIDVTRDNIRLAAEQAWAMAGLSPRPAAAAFLGMAGVVSDADRAIIRDIAASLNLAPGDKVGVDHDIRVALAGGLGLQPGIVLIVGTGSSCYGRTAAGQETRVGGWGHLLDDVGSSYYLGLEAIKAWVRSADGRLGPTELSERLAEALKLPDVQGIMHRMYHVTMSRSEIASLAPLVLETAQAGDAIAGRIVAAGLADLADLVTVAARWLAFPPDAVNVTATGGLAHSGAYFSEALYAAIRTRLPGARIREPRLSSVLGGALLALQLLGEDCSEPVLARLEAGEKKLS